MISSDLDELSSHRPFACDRIGDARAHHHATVVSRRMSQWLSDIQRMR